MGQQRRKYTNDYKAAAVERLYQPGAKQGSVSSELGITGTQLKTCWLEIEAFGSSEAKRRQKADAAELARLRKETKRSAQTWRFRIEPEQGIIRGIVIPAKASAFFATRGLCCTNPLRDSCCESSVVTGLHEQTHSADLQDYELDCLQ